MKIKKSVLRELIQEVLNENRSGAGGLPVIENMTDESKHRVANYAEGIASQYASTLGPMYLYMIGRETQQKPDAIVQMIKLDINNAVENALLDLDDKLLKLLERE